jgi:hypothetical protein
MRLMSRVQGTVFRCVWVCVSVCLIQVQEEVVVFWVAGRQAVAARHRQTLGELTLREVPVEVDDSRAIPVLLQVTTLGILWQGFSGRAVAFSVPKVWTNCGILRGCQSQARAT